LFAEMKLPGRAWLEYEVNENEGRSTIRQTALFDPIGVWGLLYWYGIWPLHQLIFAGMLQNLGREAEKIQASKTITKSKAKHVNRTQPVRIHHDKTQNA